MSQFVDGLLLQLSNPANLRQLLAPADDPNFNRLRTLLQNMYDLQSIAIQNVQTINVIKVESQRLLLTTHQTSGMWRPATPDHSRTDVTYEGSDKLEPIWLDICAEVQLTLSMDVQDGGMIQSIDKRQLEHMMIQLRPLGPQDPVNTQSYTLNLAVFIRDAPLDIAATLRSAKLARAIMERVTSYQKQLNGVEVLTPYALMVIFPQNILDNLLFPQAALQNFFAQEKVMLLFRTFP